MKLIVVEILSVKNVRNYAKMPIYSRQFLDGFDHFYVLYFSMDDQFTANET